MSLLAPLVICKRTFSKTPPNSCIKCLHKTHKQVKSDQSRSHVKICQLIDSTHHSIQKWYPLTPMLVNVLCFLGAVGDLIHDSQCSHHPQNRWEEGLVAQLSDSRFLQWKATQCCKSHLNLSLTIAMTSANNMFPEMFQYESNPDGMWQ